MSKGRKIVGTIIRSILIVFLAMIIVALNSILPNYARMADSMIGGINTKKDNSKVDTTGLDLEYNKADYTKDSIKEAEAELHQMKKVHFLKQQIQSLAFLVLIQRLLLLMVQ